MGRLPAGPWDALETRLLGSAAKYRCDREWARGGRQLHQDPFGRIYLVHEGEGLTVHHQRSFHLRPGCLFAIPAHTPSRYRCPDSMSLTYVHFTASLFGCLEVFALFGWDFVVRAGEALQATTVRVAELSRSDAPAERLEADGLLRTILARFAATVPASRQAERLGPLARFAPVLTHIEDHLEKTVTLADLADVAHLQPTYFSNLFSKEMGLPPMRYVNRRRIERAAALLRGTDFGVEEIGRRVGFADIFHFSRTFKRWTGLAPTAYRERTPAEAAQFER